MRDIKEKIPPILETATRKIDDLDARQINRLAVICTVALVVIAVAVTYQTLRGANR